VNNDFEIFAKEIEKYICAIYKVLVEIIHGKFSKEYSDLALYDLMADNSFRKALWLVLP
jgi:hypothetical protein